MILDSGMCTVYRKTDVSAPGNKPAYAREVLYVGWYGELEFETAPARPTENREEVQTDARIRILDDRRIKGGDEVILTTQEEATRETPVYKVTRAYHGRDDESGEAIADLSLKEAGLWR